MDCSNCGYRLRDNARFCPNCGVAVSIAAQQALGGSNVGDGPTMTAKVVPGPEGGWQCSICKGFVREDATFCKHCKRQLQPHTYQQSSNEQPIYKSKKSSWNGIPEVEIYPNRVILRGSTVILNRSIISINKRSFLGVHLEITLLGDKHEYAWLDGADLDEVYNLLLKLL